jgi:opacity protein-like surface antigen
MKKLLLFFAFACLSTHINAQYFEVGLTGGGSGYVGELQPGFPEPKSLGATYGAVLRYHASPRFSMKVTGMMGEFYATDRYAKNSRIYRNLEARTKYYELAATAELNLFKYDVLDGKLTSPYLFAGVAGFYFNPQARTAYGQQKEWVNLRPLGTEGQTLNGGKPYNAFQVAIPMGVGIKFALSQRINIGLEAGIRYCFTDYLDDVSGNYPDLAAISENSPATVPFVFRTAEATGSKLDYPLGEKRGDNYKSDFYYYLGASVTVNLCDKHQMEFNKSYRNFWNGSKL